MRVNEQLQFCLKEVTPYEAEMATLTLDPYGYFHRAFKKADSTMT